VVTGLADRILTGRIAACRVAHDEIGIANLGKPVVHETGEIRRRRKIIDPAKAPVVRNTACQHCCLQPAGTQRRHDACLESSPSAMDDAPHVAQVAAAAGKTPLINVQQCLANNRKLVHVSMPVNKIRRGTKFLHETVKLVFDLVNDLLPVEPPQLASEYQRRKGWIVTQRRAIVGSGMQHLVRQQIKVQTDVQSMR